MTDLTHSPLIQFCLRGLANCWQADAGCFSHAFRLDPEPHNVSIPQSDVYYTLNVLLGFSSLPDHGRSLPYDIPEIFRRCCERLVELPVPQYAYGMAMWAAAELDRDIPDRTARKIEELLARPALWRGFAAQDAGLLLSGISRLHARGHERFSEYAHPLFSYIEEKLANTRSGLFFNNEHGLRRRFGTFATQVYLTLGCFHYGDAFGRGGSTSRALACVDALEAKQGPRGEWPWFYEADSGRIMDCYQVYSVHQDGMAPAYLLLAEAQGHPHARSQLEKGFGWIFGDNELGCSMLVPEHGIILRSQRRTQPMERHVRAARAMLNWVSGRESGYIGPKRLRVDRECRSYHLGWVLYCFAGREDYGSLTHDSRIAASALASADAA